MKLGKKTLSLALCLILLVSSLLLGGVFALEDRNSAYSVGDIIYYGSYPQTEVRDESLLNELNDLTLTWYSYNYCYGDGSYDSVECSDYMRYADVEYPENSGIKYRAVVFDKYRPYYTISKTDPTYSGTAQSYQDDNGYFVNTIYWFKYEPIKWRVLDPSSGLVISSKILDSQAYNNLLYYYATNYDNGDPHCIDRYYYFSDENHTNFASDYATSSIRRWLNETFYEVAFSNSEKENILKTENENKCCSSVLGNQGYERLDSINTLDYVFLPSLTDVKNESYGFRDHYYDDNRKLLSSDYAKIQGVSVQRKFDDCIGCSYWLLRNPGFTSNGTCYVEDNGYFDYNFSVYVYYCYTYCTNVGVCPMICLKNIISSSPDTEEKYKTTFKVDGQIYSEEYYLSGETIITPSNPSKEGYRFLKWEPSVPRLMPANDITFNAVFESTTKPTLDSRINVGASRTVDYRSKVTITATADNVPSGYFLAIYDGNSIVKRGNNQTVTYEAGGMTATKTYTVKVIDSGRNVQKDAGNNPLEKDIKVEVKSGFFDKIIALFKGWFNLLPTVEIKP